MIVVALVLYLWGVKRNNALHPRHPWSVGKTVAWVGALFCTAVAIFSFVGVYDGELFWDHMVQHLILIMVAAPLFAIASPLDLAWRSTSGTAHLVVTEALRSRVARILGNPIVAFILYAVVIPVSHLTSLVQPHPRARERAQRRAPGLLARGLSLLAPDLRQRPQRAPAPSRPAVLLPLHGHPDRHLHRAVTGRREPRALPRLLRHPPDLGPVLRDRPPCRRRHHVGRRRHAHAVADDPRCPALDAHGRAQGGPDRPRARRGGAARDRRRGPVPDHPPRSISSTRTPSGSVQ